MNHLRLIAAPFLFHTLVFNVCASFEGHRSCRDYRIQCRTPRAFRELVDKGTAVRENIQEVEIISGQCRTHQYGYVDPLELTSTLWLLPKLRVVRVHDFMFFRDALARENEDWWRATTTSTPETTLNRPSLDVLQFSFEDTLTGSSGVTDASLLFLFISQFAKIDSLNFIDAKFFGPPECWNAENTVKQVIAESFPRVGIRALEADCSSRVDELLLIFRDHLFEEGCVDTLRVAVNRGGGIRQTALADFLRSTAANLVELAIPVYEGVDEGECKTRGSQFLC